MWAPRWRSAKSITPAAVSTGNAISTSTLVTSMFQVKIGIRNIVMPGARMVNMVAMMLTPVRMPERPVSRTPMHPQVRTRPGRADHLRQRRVGGPAEVGGAVGGEEAGEHRQAAEQVEPVAQGVEAGERHVPGADLQRHEVVGQPEGERPEEQEQHDAAVHREQLVVACARRRPGSARAVELGADQLGQRPAEQEEGERRDHVGDADALVVGAS